MVNKLLFLCVGGACEQYTEEDGQAERRKGGASARNRGERKDRQTGRALKT